MMFVALKDKNQCFSIIFLFWDGVNIIAYLTIGESWIS